LKQKKAKLILKDGAVFEGTSFGYEGSCAGEVVFSTAMTGYPESLTDPSYCEQILVITYPLIGNYGVPFHSKKVPSNLESEKIQVKGLVVSDYSFYYSHYEAKRSLSQWLVENGVPAITGVDTRALTQKLRSAGTMPGKIVIEKNISFSDSCKTNLVERVSCTKKEWFGSGNKKVALLDCGVKQGIMRSLMERKIKVMRVPWNESLKGLDVDGFVLSNGPGDPALLKIVVENIKELFKDERPVFGICLGNQLLGLAGGMKTYKLKFGHRGLNQPCKNLETNQCIITSQNHGYALENKEKNGFKKWFVNLNDKTVEGIRHKTKPFFSVQFHPEACPGPMDAAYLFNEFGEKL
jgi:carbamoyl-phosphate synthase small subunit